MLVFILFHLLFSFPLLSWYTSGVRKAHVYLLFGFSSVLCSLEGMRKVLRGALFKRSPWRVKRSSKGESGKEKGFALHFCWCFNVWGEISGETQREKRTVRGRKKEVEGKWEWNKWADKYFERQRWQCSSSWLWDKINCFLVIFPM